VVSDRNNQVDAADFAGLQRQADVDRDTINGLEKQAIADGETIAEFARQKARDQAEIEQLQAALVTARRIGAAIGIVMVTHKVAEDGAFALLREKSQCDRMKLRDLAERVLLTGTLD
jgi:AmiR/NasT family two-component response regulator